MSDLIERQAAIDAINHICPVDTEYDCTLLDRVDGRYVLSDLPSAQPEIIRCKDCKHWTNNIGDSKLRDNYCNDEAHGFYYQCSEDDYCSFAERRTDVKADKGASR